MGIELPPANEPDQLEMARQIADTVLQVVPVDDWSEAFDTIASEYRQLLERDYPDLTEAQLDLCSVRLRRAVLDHIRAVLLGYAGPAGNA